MKTVEKNRQLLTTYDENCAAISDLAGKVEKENRDMTDSERTLYNSLRRENEIIAMKLQAASKIDADNNSVENQREAAETLIRENVKNGKQTALILTRDVMMVADVDKGAVVPIRLQDVLKPLEESLILDKLGLPFMSGLAGEYVWPTYEMVEAQIAGEGVALTEKKVTLSNLRATPDRIGLAIPATHQAINQSQGFIETIIKEIMPKALARLLNKVLLSREKVTGATNLTGPFVGLEATPIKATFKDLNLLKASIYAKGIEGDAMCFVMTKALKAELEATPKDPGSGIMVCENDHICGIPVFTSQAIGEGYVGLGDWRYQPMGLFGDIRFVIDPYTKAGEDVVRFIINADYGTKTLRKEAFVLAQIQPTV